jgi:predicted permease
MGSILRNVRFAIRRLLRTPIFTFIAIIGIAISIGTNTAVFSLVNGIVLRPLPYEHADRLVVVSGQHPQIGSFSASYPDFIDLKENSTAFEYFAAFYQKSFNLTRSTGTERVRGLYVSASFFPMFGVQPAVGRFFLPKEEMTKEAPVVVLNYALWRDRFGSDPQIAGQSVILNNESYTIIGVAPATFRPPVGGQVWVPLYVPDAAKTARGTRSLGMLAMIKPDISIKEAQTQLDVITSQLEQQYPDTNAGRRAVAIPLHEHLTKKDRLPLLMIFGAVIFVLFIACFNLTNLFMARALARMKQVGISLALGATRMNVIMQLLTESMLLALTGGALGLLFAVWTRDIVVTWLSVTPLIQTTIDLRILLFTLGVSLLTGFISGLVPALKVSRVNPLSIIRGGSSSGLSSRRNNLLRGLVSVEVALALTLVIGAILMLKSLSALQQVDLGFNPDNLLTANISIPEGKYSTPEQQTTFFNRVLQQAETLPGVQSAALINLIPFSETSQATKFLIEGRPAPAPSAEQINRASYHMVSPRYFEAMKIPLISGRTFTEYDRKGAQDVAIISKKMAERFWAGTDPVGQRISLEDTPETLITIVGVVGDVKYLGLEAESEVELYQPFLQSPETSMALVIRGANTSALAAPVRQVVWSVDKNQPVDNIRTMEQIIEARLGKDRALTKLLGLFSFVAVFLAGLGIYGVISYSVNQRTREIGIRMVLGAQRGDILGLILKQSLIFILLGVGVGLVGAHALTWAISGLLYGVKPLDVITFALSSLLIILIGVIASYIPARRALYIEPIAALREEQ